MIGFGFGFGDDDDDDGRSFNLFIKKERLTPTRTDTSSPVESVNRRFTPRRARVNQSINSFPLPVERDSS